MLSKYFAMIPRTHFGAYVNSSAQGFSLIEGIQGNFPSGDLSIEHARKTLKEAVEYNIHGPSVQGVQGGLSEIYQNTPKEKNKTQDKFTFSLKGMKGLCGKAPASHKCERHSFIQLQSSKTYHTSSKQYGLPRTVADNYDDTPNPQGIQGEDCTLELWMENCLRYNLPHCNEQLKNIKEGRKTLSQVFAEQEQLIKDIAESYKASRSKNAHARLNLKNVDTNTPCPQGVQGDDCIRFKLWLENCQRFSFSECQQQLNGVMSGRKTLAQIFAEQDAHIRQIARDYLQRRNYSTSSKRFAENPEVGNNLKSPSNPEKLSQKDRLKRAVKEYGSTVIVFHIGISLISLGGFYLAVSSGIDMVSLLTKLGIGETLLQSKITTGASTFVVAYAVHKVFAPVRIGITLTSVPFIVRYLRKIGFLKPPKGL